jgi:hypothetical protein
MAHGGGQRGDLRLALRRLACALGWPVLTLYGLRWHAPYANLAATGPAFVAA